MTAFFLLVEPIKKSVTVILTLFPGHSFQSQSTMKAGIIPPIDVYIIVKA
jgi:hypothetical protein